MSQKIELIPQHDDSLSSTSSLVEDLHSCLVSSNYERIRVVGKGSFGLAVLYRLRNDDSLVILKEINLHELSSNERQLALNEVNLLSCLHHPNIISYYDSFEENGVLMIEMEYADGGTLAQYLSKQTKLLEESEIVLFFRQMSCAVSYLHYNNVLHRDLKTANVFLTIENMVKIGDFGISKHMGTGTKFYGAQTILGTPYYLSPEMCKGNLYNEKSDIWALGCCLYEMICLRKTFDGTSLPILVKKIVNAEYEQIKGPFSNQLKLLVREMLKTEPEQRPTAERVLKIVQRHQKQLFKTQKSDSKNGVNDNYDNNENEFYSNQIKKKKQQKFKPSIYSTLYCFDTFNVTLSVVPSMPTGKIKQLVVGNNHQIALTDDYQVYSWGNNDYGQLGHGDRRPRNLPTRIDALTNRNISKIAVGNTFSVFCVDQGIAMACGESRFMGDESASDDWLKPKIIDSLLRENIIDLVCGDNHIVALCESGQILAWGNGKDGQLGTGNCKSVYFPIKVIIPTCELITSIKCGPDCTVFITEIGTIIATGSNRYNKLNLNSRIGFFANTKESVQNEISNVLNFTTIRPFQSRVIDVSLGPNHSGVLLENGHLHLFGRNMDGELGIGNRNPMSDSTPFTPVKALLNKTCVQLICGEGFTMAATTDNELYFWGYKGCFNFSHSYVNKFNNTDCPTNLGTAQYIDDPMSTLNAIKQPKKGWQWGRNNSSQPSSPSMVNTPIAITQPSLVLRLDVNHSKFASKSNQTPLIELAALVCSRNIVMVVVDTSSISNNTNSANINECRVPQQNKYQKRRQSALETNTKNFSTTVDILDENGKSKDKNFIEELNSTQSCNFTCYDPEEIQLINAIEHIKQELAEQKIKTPNLHKEQSSVLQQKLLELQTLQENKSSKSQANNSFIKPKVLRNPFLPETQTKVCVIL